MKKAMHNQQPPQDVEPLDVHILSETFLQNSDRLSQKSDI